MRTVKKVNYKHIEGTEELIYRIVHWNNIFGSDTRWLRNNLCIPMDAKASHIKEIDPFTDEKTVYSTHYRRTWTDGDYELMAIYTVVGKFDGLAIRDKNKNFYVSVTGFASHNVKSHVQYKSGYVFPWER